MERITPRTLSGFMELLPGPQAQMDVILDVLRRTYALYGFTAIDTPAVEAAEILLAKGGGETEKQIYRFMKGEHDLALRFDLTVPLAKYVAMNYGQLAFPFRRYQIGKVYRGERSQRGRFREFYQADIDVIGDGTLDIANDAEMPAVICAVFRRLGIERFCIRMNNRKVLNGLFEHLGVQDPAAVMGAIDKLEKIGRAKVEALLAELGLGQDQIGTLMDLLLTDEPLAALEPLAEKNETLAAGLGELKAVTALLPSLGVPDGKWRIDLTIARGLDYYTGTVYETTLLDNPEVGSVCSGGRYDDLAGYYTNRKLPGVGLSIGVTRLFYILQEQKLLNDALPTAPCDGLILPMDGQCLAYASACATALRQQGVRTQVYMEGKKFRAKLEYANRLGVPFALIIGGDEMAAGTVGLKDLRAGTQQTVTADQAATIIKQSLDKDIKPVKGS